MNSIWENPMSSWRSRVFALALMAGAAFPAWSQNAIQSINSSQQAGAEVIRIELSEALTAVPAGFTVQAPPRVALDLPGVTNGLGKSTVEINQGNLRSVSIAQAGERTRLVLNLKAPAGYRAQIDGKVLIVSLENNAPATLASSSGQTDALRRKPQSHPAVAARHRFPARLRRRRPGRRRAAEQPGRRRHPPAGPEPGRRVPPLEPARQPAPPPRRHRFRHAGAEHHDDAAGRPRPHGGRSARCLGAQRLPERQPVRARGARAEGRPEQARPGRRLRGREALAQLPEHRGPGAAAGHRRLHQLQRRHQRHRHRQRHAALEGRALGPGARHHPAGEEPGPAQVGQRHPDRAQGRAERQGEDRAGGEAADRRARARAHPVVPAELREGAGHRERDHRPEHGVERIAPATRRASSRRAAPWCSRPGRTSSSSPTSRPSSKKSRR